MKQAASQAKQIARFRVLQREWLAITRRHPQADPDNVWHTLVSLESPPVERMRLGLLRARTRHLSRR
jgi:hypothetical protein